MLVQTHRDQPREGQELRAGGGGLALLGGSSELLSASGSVFFSWQLRSSALSTRITLLTKYFALT